MASQIFQDGHGTGFDVTPPARRLDSVSTGIYPPTTDNKLGIPLTHVSNWHACENSVYRTARAPSLIGCPCAIDFSIGNDLPFAPCMSAASRPHGTWAAQRRENGRLAGGTKGKTPGHARRAAAENQRHGFRPHRNPRSQGRGGQNLIDGREGGRPITGYRGNPRSAWVAPVRSRTLFAPS